MSCHVVIIYCCYPLMCSILPSLRVTLCYLYMCVYVGERSSQSKLDSELRSELTAARKEITQRDKTVLGLRAELSCSCTAVEAVSVIVQHLSLQLEHTSALLGKTN